MESKNIEKSSVQKHFGDNPPKGKLFVITGPSGVGKGTILERFFHDNKNIIYSISQTTRKPRPGEVHGVNYFFVSHEDFEKSIQNDELLEWAKYSDNYYGTKKDFVLKALEKGADVLLEIETKGAKKITEKFPDCITVFFTPPNLDELEKRLRGRKTEDEASIQKRLKIVKEELELSTIYKYTIENDEVENALNKLQAVYDFEKRTKNEAQSEDSTCETSESEAASE